MVKKRSLSEWDGGRKSPLFWIATWFGSGLLKPAPGTWGTLAGVPLVVLLMLTDYWIFYIICTSFLFNVGSRVIDKTEKLCGIHDAPEIVIDEVVGLLVACLPALYLYHMSGDPTVSYMQLAIAFVLFRAFDILKPWPIGPIDRKMKGGEGVMTDDFVAGLMAAGVQAAWLYAYPYGYQ